MKRIAQDFVTLFNVLWYRDFPLQYGVRESGRRAEWTTHIAVCVRSAADLLGYFTHFEAGRTDAIIKDATGKSIANAEWEWTQPCMKGFNELEKLRAACGNVQFSALITYSREEHHIKNLKLLERQWIKSGELLLAFLVRFSYHQRGRHFSDLETYGVQGGKLKRVRRQAALPWQRVDTRWGRLTSGAATDSGGNR